MSDVLKLDVPKDGLLGKPHLKGITSIVTSFQPLNDEKKTVENVEESNTLDAVQTVGDRFITIKRLGSGGFGEVYLAKDSQQNDRLLAIKFEPTKTSRPQLPIEKCVFQIMSECVYIPKMFYFGTHREYTVLVMDLLGPSVEDLLSFCGRKFSSKTICMIAEQTLRGVEALHHHSLIHRDLKPDNFLLGMGMQSHLVHLIDFGLCKNYRHPLTYEHIPFRTGKTLTGTARYCSLFTHHGLEQSRRDDLECLSYILIYLAKGSLPWMSVKISNRRKRNEKLTELKASVTSNELCSNLPEEFQLFYQYSRTLAYSQRPDYGYLRNLLLAAINRSKEKYDYIYDWHLMVRVFKDNLDAGKPILPRR